LRETIAVSINIDTVEEHLTRLTPSPSSIKLERVASELSPSLRDAKREAT
jgi:hypothetical protein